MSNQWPVSASRVRRDGVVEVLGIHRVDGDDELLGEVLAARRSSSSNFAAWARASARTSSGNWSGMPEGPHHRGGVHLRVAGPAEDFDDDPFPAFLGGGEADHLEDDFVVRLDSLHRRVAKCRCCA